MSLGDMRPDLVLVSASWTPEMHQNQVLNSALNKWARNGVPLAALDTGAFILARAGLLNGHRATVHYEHLDAFGELFPDIEAREELWVIDRLRMTCCGGAAAGEFALHLLGEAKGPGLANAAARYLFHHNLRGPDVSQNPPVSEPFGKRTPTAIRQAIDIMETHLETPLTIPEICQRIDLSQRQLGRLFRTYVGKTPILYYRDIRLDRARGLVTQTDMPLTQVAVASGFSGQVHFSRAYRDRFGIPPSQDRIEGRVPFEFRAWPMYSPTPKKA